MMDKEIYLWITFFVVVIAAALYFRYFYQQGIMLSVSLGQNSASAYGYPYQTVSVPVKVVNTGSSNIQNLDIGIAVNGNVSTVYKVSVPAGKQDTFYYNITRSTSGTFSLSTVVDPDKAYNIADRSATQSTFNVIIKSPEKPEAYTLLPRNGITAANVTASGATGYVAASYLFFNYSLDKVAISPVLGIRSFLYPLLDVAAPYVRYIDTANAHYADTSVYSIWIQGYLSPNIIYVGAIGKSLNVSNDTVAGRRVTFINQGNYTTLCSWYENGWIKILGVAGKGSCLDLVGLQNSTTVQSANSSLSSNVLYSKLITPYDNILENNTGFVGNKTTAGILTAPSGANVLIYKTITTNDIGIGNVCYGVLSAVNGISYCSTYIFPKYALSQNFSIERTTAYVNGDNLSVLAVVNTSKVLQQVPININVLRSFGISGSSVSFVSGLHNSCYLGNLFVCSNATFGNGAIKFVLSNNYTSDIRIGSMACYHNSRLIFAGVNRTVPKGGSLNMSSACYENGNVIQGVPLGLSLGITMNYTVANQANSINGAAYIAVPS